MARKMQINRLDKDELEYLLTVRGVATGNCEEMRKRLSSALRMEHEGASIKYPRYPYTFEEDQLAVGKKLEDLRQMIDDFRGSKKCSEGQKLQTKLAFVMERLENMEPNEEEALMKEKSELLASALTLMNKMYEIFEDNEGKPSAPVPAALNLLETQLDPHVFTGIHQASGSSPMANPVTPNFPSGKTIPPHKWNLKKFSGDLKDVTVHSFFEQVEELRVARNVAKEDLLEAGIDLFEKKAYQFYKDCKKRVTSWDGLVKEFKEEYLSANHSDLLFDELRKRTQHPSESIGVYLAVMSSYFNRLGCSMSEEAMLSIVMKNLHPFYQDRLGDPLPTTLQELRSVCRRMEARRDLMERYVEPTSSRRGNILEKDLAYVSVEEDLNTIEASSSQPRQVRTKEIVCFKCQQPGHKAIGCASPTKKKCFKCKREGYTIRTCPNCSSQQGNAMRRT